MVLLPENGRLEDTSLPRLLLDLYAARFGGSVELRRERVEKTLRFHEGIPVFAESNLKSESLATRLLHAGTLTHEGHAQVIERVERERCKEGQALLDLELVPTRDVFEALKEQVRCRLLECFGWIAGTFRVAPGEAPPDGTQAFRADFFQLLQEGIETRWSSDRILAELAPHMARYTTVVQPIEDLVRQLRSDAAVDAVLGAIDGNRTLWQLREIATTPRALATIWLLDALGALHYADAPSSRSVPEATPVPEIEIVFEKQTSGDGGAEPSSLRRPKGVGASFDGPPNAATTRLIEDIAAKFARLEDTDHYSLLGVDPRAEAETIKRAYLRAAKDYHPDVLARTGITGKMRTQASRVFAKIGKAYTTVSRADLRKEYDAHLAGDDLGVDAEQIATAETLYRKGEILLRQGNFRGALEFLLPAVEIYPDEADYQNAAGWALYKQHPSQPERAKPHLERAAELAPENALAHFRSGVVLRSLRETEAAEAAFSRARQIDPKVG